MSGIYRNDEKLVEKYISKTKPDESYADTTIFYYSKLIKTSDFSFCKKLEQQKKICINKIRILYNSKNYKGYAFKLPKREFWFERKNVDIGDTKEVEDLFIRFKSCIKS